MLAEVLVMGSLAILQSLKDSVLGQADVKAIYGQPIAAHDKTIVPVAKIMFAYGAGAGTGGMGNNNPRGEGGRWRRCTSRPRGRLRSRFPRRSFRSRY